jgi:hypothetical protein
MKYLKYYIPIIGVYFAYKSNFESIDDFYIDGHFVGASISTAVGMAVLILIFDYLIHG